MDPLINAAAEVIRDADALLIGAGAGFGVDSGLPDFRGNEGFWNAYPPFRNAGLSFYDLANPTWFNRRPELGWGFYGHRMNLYRDTQPHVGFEWLLGMAQQRPDGYFVFTSNVDGHFQRVGFGSDSIVECHGSIHHLQCAKPCGNEVWSADDIEIGVNETTFEASDPLPKCGTCSDLARPNVLMFGDYHWVANRTEAQYERYQQWLRSVRKSRLAIIEFGAGKSVPTVRHECERHGGKLIRINPRESDAPYGAISIAAPARATLEELARVLNQQRG